MRWPAEMEGLSKTDSHDVTPKMSRVQLKISRHTKSQENLNVNEEENQQMPTLR